jgi:hypothetical protein
MSSWMISPGCTGGRAFLLFITSSLMVVLKIYVQRKLAFEYPPAYFTKTLYPHAGSVTLLAASSVTRSPER